MREGFYYGFTYEQGWRDQRWLHQKLQIKDMYCDTKESTNDEFFIYGISLIFQKVNSKWHLSIQSCHLLFLNRLDSHVTLNEIEQAQVGLDMIKQQPYIVSLWTWTHACEQYGIFLNVFWWRGWNRLRIYFSTSYKTFDDVA